MSIAASSHSRRRAKEKILWEHEEFLREDFKANCAIQLEQRASIKIEKQNVFNRTKDIAEKENSDLERRRAKLSELYQNEMNEWRNKLKLSRTFSEESRIQGLQERALKLKENRELKQRVFVKSCYDRQWKESCDDVRTLESRAVIDKLMFDRKSAFVFKEANTKDVNGDDLKKLVEIRQRSEDLKHREIKEKEERDRKNLEMKHALDEQVKTLRLKNKILTKIKRQEEIEQLEQLYAEDAREKQKKDHITKEAHKRGKEMFHASMKRIEHLEQDKAVERFRDTVVLNYALDKEKNQIFQEIDQKRRGKEAVKEYLGSVGYQMKNDQRDKESLENIQNTKIENICKEQEAIRKDRDDDYRNISMEEVNVTRFEQIRGKKIKLEEALSALATEVVEKKLEWENEDQIEKTKIMKKKDKTIENMMRNKATVEGLSRKKQSKNSEKKILHDEILLEEKLYNQKVLQAGIQLLENINEKN